MVGPMLNALLVVMLPVFLVVAVGFVLARSFTIDQLSLNKVQLYALTPALAYSSIMRTTVQISDVAQLAAGYFIVTIAAGGLAALVARLLPTAVRRGVIASVMLGNNGNFGLPIALLALGQPGLDQAIVIFMFAIAMLWTVGPALFGAALSTRGVLVSIMRLPVIWAMVLAVTLRMLDFEPPPGITTGVDMMGQASVPMILIALGIQLGYARRVLVNATVVTAVVLRLVIVPLMGWGIGLLVGLRGLELQSIVLALSMPTAVNVFLLALEFRQDAETVASVVAVSTVVSLVTISLVVANLPVLA